MKVGKAILYTRECPSCGNGINYCNKSNYTIGLKRGSVCQSCCNSRRTYTEEQRKRNSESHLGQEAWNKGLKTPLNARKKQSIAKRGKPSPQRGKAMSDAQKQKCRASTLKRLVNNGIPPNEDKGAKEFFQYLNSVGFAFAPKAFLDLGYIADGYDASKHIWVEFDTPYHFYATGELKPKDVERQQNIIRYFEGMHRPLKGFVRVKADKNGTVINTRCVYKAQTNHLTIQE